MAPMGSSVRTQACILWAMKRKAQARDHELAARGEMPHAAMLLLRPKSLQGAVVEWPDASLIDD